MADTALAQTVPGTEPSASGLEAPRWSLARRILFRFLCCYFVLYCLPEGGRINIFSIIPGANFLANKYTGLWHTLCPWVAIHLFHVDAKVSKYIRTGSGDTTLAYVQNFLFVAFAVAGALVWSILDRRRPNYRVLESWLRLLVRYTLAFTLFGYGFAKVFPLQFGPPGFMRLIEPYGDFSPMGALWWFMGASIPYIIFSGAAEVLGGLLLLTRRTATLGSLVAFAVLLNVAVLNYCYDVPVKLYSSNLVLMSVYLAAPEARRLARFFVLNRPTGAADLSLPALPRRWMRVSAVVFQVVFVGATLGESIWGGWQAYKSEYVHPQRPPLYGLYDVERFTRNGQDVPPLGSDASRWRKVAVQFDRSMSVKMMDDSTRSFATEYDAAHNTVSLTIGKDKGKYPLSWSRPDPDHVQLEGKLQNDVVSVYLKNIDTSKFLLFSRGFHWINELPFNR